VCLLFRTVQAYHIQKYICHVYVDVCTVGYIAPELFGKQHSSSIMDYESVLVSSARQISFQGAKCECTCIERGAPSIITLWVVRKSQCRIHQSECVWVWFRLLCGSYENPDEEYTKMNVCGCGLGCYSHVYFGPFNHIIQKQNVSCVRLFNYLLETCRARAKFLSIGKSEC
jgi:hypothetical protein